MLYALIAALLLLTDDAACDAVLYYFPAVGRAVAARAEATGLKTPDSGPVLSYQLSALREWQRSVPLCPTFEDGDAVRRAGWLVQGQRDFGADYQRHCERLSACEAFQAARWDALRSESVAACLLWELLADSLPDGSWQYDAFAPARRRLALRDLKKSLGERNFAAGLMPDVVPWRKFTRIEP